MKKFLSLSLMALLLFSCNSNEKKESTTTGNENTALYEQNLAVVKNLISAFENKNMDDFFGNVADSVTWNSPVYGDTVHTKAHWRESLQYWVDNWDNLHLTTANYLPGLDSATHVMDGSVRYYGQWDGVHKVTGTPTRVLIYEYYEFDKDHKVIADGQYFDVGGLMNSVQQKK